MTQTVITFEQQIASKLATKLKCSVVPLNEEKAIEGLLRGRHSLYVATPKSGNPIVKIVAHLALARKVARLGRQYQLATGQPVKVKQVFSNHERPVAIFDHNSKASSYANTYILPGLGSGPVGLAKKWVHKLTAINPAIDGVLVMPTGSGEPLTQALVEANVVEHAELAEMSSLCIDSSKDIFLYFSTMAKPKLACYLVPRDKGAQIKQDRDAIYRALGTLVPKPLALIETGNQSVFVESGLSGCPWFQLLRNQQTSWEETKRIAVTTLRQFQQNVLGNPQWQTKQALVREVESQFKLSAGNSPRLAAMEALPPLVKRLTKTLPAEAIESFDQHGDFCINNLLFLADSAQIIDWDEFGHNKMPLQDEICLALSFHNGEGKHGLAGLDSNMQMAMQGSCWLSRLSAAGCSAMFLYHLLYRLGEWGNNPNRAGICDWLLRILEEFVASPDDLFSWMSVREEDISSTLSSIQTN